jgi:hypothetical protein
MPSALTKSVYRRCAQGRDEYVVAIETSRGDSPPRIAIREKGRSTWYSVEVGKLYVQLVRADVDARPRKRARRVTRGLLTLR